MNVDELTPHQALQCFLQCSYQYYHRFTSLIDDTEYDALAKFLLKTYDEWQDHQHSYLVSKDDLKAGTLYALNYYKYQTMVVQASEIWSREKYYE